MTILDRVQSRNPFSAPTQFSISAAQLVLIGILVIAVFSRFWRLGDPAECYFDEVYFPTTAAEILHGKNDAWEFYGHENTHPPLSKEIMALGEGIFGHESQPLDNKCWPDQANASHRTDPDWTYKPYGWRFFGALAGVGAVLFMYLLAKKLFQSEIAGLAGAAFLTFDGLALAQSRIATPDTYVLFFVLGALYFLVLDRKRTFLLSGMFFGAASACKWIGAFTMAPIIVFLAFRIWRRVRETPSDERLRTPELALQIGAAIAGLGAFLAVFGAFVFGGFAAGVKTAAAPMVVALLFFGVALALIAFDKEARRTPRGKVYLEAAWTFPVFFLAAPFVVYALTYIPMLLEGHGVAHAIDLNRQAYEFHSSLNATHGYSSPWDTWPIMLRPIYFYVNDTGGAKIYSLGNPAVFWMGLPALAFLLFRGLRLNARLQLASWKTNIRGALDVAQWPLLFVVLGYIGMWLPWATQPRLLFIYHYLPALAFVILALAYCVHYLWNHQSDWGRFAAVGTVVLAGITFAYFYPHLTAINVSHTLDESYYWIGSWR